MAEGKRKARQHATDLVALRRVEDFVRIRLDGAEFWDLRDFVREKEKEAGSAWFLGPEQEALSDSQLHRYRQEADKLIRASVATDREKLLKEHLARRRSLYAKATLAGDLSTALAVLRDEAKLVGLYPEDKKKPPADVPAVAVLFIEVNRDDCRPRALPAAGGGGPEGGEARLTVQSAPGPTEGVGQSQAGGSHHLGRAERQDLVRAALAAPGDDGEGAS